MQRQHLFYFVPESYTYFLTCSPPRPHTDMSMGDLTVACIVQHLACHTRASSPSIAPVKPMFSRQMRYFLTLVVIFAFSVRARCNQNTSIQHACFVSCRSSVVHLQTLGSPTDALFNSSLIIVVRCFSVLLVAQPLHLLELRSQHPAPCCP